MAYKDILKLCMGFQRHHHCFSNTIDILFNPLVEQKLKNYKFKEYIQRNMMLQYHMSHYVPIVS